MPHQAGYGGLACGRGTTGAAACSLSGKGALSRQLEFYLASFEFEGCGDGSAEGAFAFVLEVVSDDVFFAEVLDGAVDRGDDESEGDDTDGCVREEESAGGVASGIEVAETDSEDGDVAVV